MLILTRVHIQGEQGNNHIKISPKSSSTDNIDCDYLSLHNSLMPAKKSLDREKDLLNRFTKAIKILKNLII